MELTSGCSPGGAGCADPRAVPRASSAEPAGRQLLQLLQSQRQSRTVQCLLRVFSLCTPVAVLLVCASTVRLQKAVCTSPSSGTVCALDLGEELPPGGSSRASSKCVNADTAFGAWHHGAISCPDWWHWWIWCPTCPGHLWSDRSSTRGSSWAGSP